MLKFLNPCLQRTLYVCLVLVSLASYAQKKSYRWQFSADQGIQWKVRAGDKHIDHIDVAVKMENGTLLKKIWDGKKAIEFILT